MHQIGNIAVDEFNATVSTRPFPLTAFEHKVLLRLAQHRGQVVALADLHMALYGNADKARESNVVEVIIGRLRKKLTKAGAHAEILTTRRRGYTIDAIEVPVEVASA